MLAANSMKICVIISRQIQRFERGVYFFLVTMQNHFAGRMGVDELWK